MTQETQPFCPHLTGSQIVAMGFKAQVLPMGKARVQSMPPSAMNLKSGGLGQAASLLGEDVVVYQVEAGFGYKIPPGQKPGPDAPMVAETIVVPCQRGKCAWWSEKFKSCTGGMPEAFFDAVMGPSQEKAEEAGSEHGNAG